jgi:hypothetical protein
VVSVRHVLLIDLVASRDAFAERHGGRGERRFPMRSWARLAPSVRRRRRRRRGGRDSGGTASWSGSEHRGEDERGSQSHSAPTIDQPSPTSDPIRPRRKVLLKESPID